MSAHEALNSLILGLGLFFLGLRLVGDNLRDLAGGSLRTGIARTVRRPVLRSLLGLAAGALMQSATAVTFICVSMMAAGLLNSAAAAGIIVWSNVGLTALAFVATLDIHPVVAMVVGCSGIVLGVVRIRSWQTVAGVLLGMGLILFGLQQMGSGAAPLRDAAWFRAGIDAAVASPPLAFLAGILAAAILQSNTGATMMVITLAGAGAIPFESAALLIYGTNLGAIALRLLLAAGMKGEGLRLVRLEDLFCIVSGLIMLALFYLEATGIPLVFALARGLAGTTQTELAVVFFLSNFIPALVMVALRAPAQALLQRLFPAESTVVAGSPQFISSRALAHPGVAVDLLRRELARLLRLAGERSEGPEAGAPQAFLNLANAIEAFTLKLAETTAINPKETECLHRLRAALSGIRHLEEALRFFANRDHGTGSLPQDKAKRLDEVIAGFVSDGAAAMDQLDLEKIAALAEQSRKHGTFIQTLHKEIFGGGPSAENLDSSALAEDFRVITWTFHHLMTLLAKLPASPVAKHGTQLVSTN